MSKNDGKKISWDSIPHAKWGHLYIHYHVHKVPHAHPPTPEEYSHVTFRAILMDGTRVIQDTAKTDHAAAEKATWAAMRHLEPEWFEKPAEINPYVIQHVAEMTPDIHKYRADAALRQENQELRKQIAKLEAELARKVAFIEKMSERDIRVRNVIQHQFDPDTNAAFDDTAKTNQNVIIMPGQDGSFDQRQREVKTQERIEDRVEEEINKSNLRVFQAVKEKVQSRTPREAAQRRTHAGFLTSPEVKNGEKTQQ